MVDKKTGKNDFKHIQKKLDAVHSKLKEDDERISQLEHRLDLAEENANIESQEKDNSDLKDETSQEPPVKSNSQKLQPSDLDNSMIGQAVTVSGNLKFRRKVSGNYLYALNGSNDWIILRSKINWKKDHMKLQVKSTLLKTTYI
jgi:RecJ-like exonuclease